MKSKKIALLFSNYGPYHLARLKGSFNYFKENQCQVLGIELARYLDTYPWKSEIENLPFSIVSVTKDQKLEQTNFIELIRRFHSVLEQVDPEVLAISGYSRPTMLFALLWCHWHRKPAILLSESTEHDAPRSWWREKLKSWIVTKYQAALVGGQPQKRYLIKLGMPADAIFLGYDVVGNEVFHPDKIKSLPRQIEKPYFLAINRFVPKKNLSFLISCYAAYRQEMGENAWDLVLSGDGELRPQIEQQIDELGLSDTIHLPGFLQQDQLLPYFAHASCFIHASIQEQWGLVVNEAMAAGLPVLVSNHCGCFEDLVIEGVNGFGFDPENSQQLTDLMLKLSSGNIDLEKIGQAALAHIQKFSPNYFAQGLELAIQYTLEHS